MNFDGRKGEGNRKGSRRPVTRWGHLEETGGYFLLLGFAQGLAWRGGGLPGHITCQLCALPSARPATGH